MRKPAGIWLLIGLFAACRPTPHYDTIIRHAAIYDGTGKPAFNGDLGIKNDTIAAIGDLSAAKADQEIDAKGSALSPGFIDMQSQSMVSLLQDGRSMGAIHQGVTLEIFGEGSSEGPYTDSMKTMEQRDQGDIKYNVTWTTLRDYLQTLQKKGVSTNVASFVGAATLRENLVGFDNRTPDSAQLEKMKTLTRQAMEDGALGIGSALIYAPGSYAKTPELIEVCKIAAPYGGSYISHVRSEGNQLLQAADELIRIARDAHIPAIFYHLKAAGKNNWYKMDALIAKIDSARKTGLDISACMYTYTAGATGFDASMPTDVQEGGLDKWIARLKDPAIRTRVLAEMRDPSPTWENLLQRAGPKGALLLEFKNPALKPLTGKTLDEVAAMRGVSPEEAAMQLVVEDGSRVGTAYFLMSEDNVRREVALPWVSFGSDASAPAPEGVFLESNEHPRAYGNFVRVLAKYVRDENVITLQEAIRKLSALPAQNLSLKDRGMLRKGYFADVVIFDPRTVQDHATYERPHQLSTGVEEVWINGIEALRNGNATGNPSGRVVRGRAWTGYPGGGCRASSQQWTWSK